ncbi:MAG: methylcobamide--CoM methyltransferase, partial [Syntrophomonadaceae bacterium]|nr:methylcobamide--CoM methyltransferase [Syntrophomonadaceae bacterium]
MKTFTARERLLAVAKKLPADRAPCICPGGMMNMMFREIMEESGCPWPEAHTDPQKMAALVCTLNESGGFENYGLPFCMTVEAEAMGARVNMGNLLCEPHVIASPLTSSAEINLLKPLNIDVGRARVVVEAIKILRGRG